jgi:hypothetical protein
LVPRLERHWDTALHEAGHVAAILDAGLVPQWCGIGLVQPEPLGVTHTPWRIYRFPTMSELAIYPAGCIAQGTPITDPQASGDHQRFKRHLRKSTTHLRKKWRRKQVRNLLRERAMLRARGIIARRRTFVLKVARKLMRQGKIEGRNPWRVI